MREQELSISLWIGGFLIGAVGILISTVGGILVYVFSRHRDDNDSDHENFKIKLEEHDEEITVLKTEHNLFRGGCKNERS